MDIKTIEQGIIIIQFRLPENKNVSMLKYYCRNNIPLIFSTNRKL